MSEFPSYPCGLVIIYRYFILSHDECKVLKERRMPGGASDVSTESDFHNMATYYVWYQVYQHH